jgi:hypothetical protein
VEVVTKSGSVMAVTPVPGGPREEGRRRGGGRRSERGAVGRHPQPRDPRRVKPKQKESQGIRREEVDLDSFK